MNQATSVAVIPRSATTLSAGQIADAARRIDAAERTRTQIGHLSLQYPAMNIEDAYAIQRAWVALKLAAGRSLRGHKVGLTSRAMQQSSQINEPDFGDLLDDMFYETGASLPMTRFIVPRVEVELAFILKNPLRGPGVTLADVLAATDYVMPALEIIDARIRQIDVDTGRPRRVFDTISDNAANAAIVLGGHPVRPTDVDLRWVSALLYCNGTIEESGVAAAVLNHPANGVVWLANKLAQYGVSLEVGETILGGSFTRPVNAAAGDQFHVDYGALGAVSCQFV
jgi:2-oxo-hept-3-ene-1,7-dioate hydratase